MENAKFQQSNLNVARRFGSIALCVLLLLSFAQKTFSQTPTATISVNGGVTTGTISTQMSTNNVWSGSIDGVTGGQAKFNALQAPLVRIHVGDDGGFQAMPEINQNEWANPTTSLFQGDTRPFESLDQLVNNVFLSGQTPLMNFKFAPDWMWTCYPNSLGVNNTQGTGTVADLSFSTFASYMARIVSYYNKGSMTTETGQVVTNPSGTAHKITWWELWNEPDLSIETPCATPTSYDPGQVALTPSDYVKMWNAVTSAMLAVDPTLKFVGPATAGSQFGSTTGGTNNTYIDQLMANATHKPDALSFHDYGYWDNTVSDKFIFDGDNSDPSTNCCGGIPDMKAGVNAIHSKYPTVPIWLTEVNVNADWGNDTHKRPWSEFAAAWWGSVFQQLAPLNVAMIHQYDVADAPQFGLFSDVNTKNFMSYYILQLLDSAFPPGSTILSSTSTKSDIQQLAVRKPNGSISVLVVNRQLSTGASNCGTGGLPATVAVNLSGISPTSVTLQELQASNVDCTGNGATAPAVTTLTPSTNLSVSFPGYGMAVFNITTGGPTVTPAPLTNTPTPAPITQTPSPTISQATPTPTPAVGSGDVNGDGVVNSLDAKAILTAWLTPASGIGGANQYGDTIINNLDYEVVAGKILQVTPTLSITPTVIPPTPTKTPTPSVTQTPTVTPTPSLVTATPTPGTSPTFSALHISGNKLLNAQNQVVQLHGVNHSGLEYACIQGWGFFDTPDGNVPNIAAMKSWHINAVNIGLNEDCWLGINGVPTAYGGTNYQNTVANYVNQLLANGIYPMISMFWTAPGTQQALDLATMADADHTPATWTSIANKFKGDNRIMFRLLEEPHPVNGDTTAGWNCWLNGGANGVNGCNEGFSAAGMQTLLSAVRNTGSSNIVWISGVDYAATFDQFLTHVPVDPLNNIGASTDVYPGGANASDTSACHDLTCYNSYYKPVIAQFPFIAGEFGESVNGDVCATTKTDEFLNWMDSNSASGYFAWTWNTWGTTCGDLSLITNFDGTAHSPNGTYYKNRLLSEFP